MTIFKNKYIFTIIPILVLLWVVSINKFPEGYIYNSGDFSQPINLENTFSSLFQVWGSRLSSPGEGGFFSWFSAMPYYFLFYLIPLKIGLSETQVLSYILFMFLSISYLSFYVACNIFYPDKRSNFTKIFSLIYALNLTTLYFFTYTWGFSHQVFLYMTIPLLAATFYKLIKKFTVKNLAFFLIVLILSIPGFTNSAFFVALCLFLGVFMCALFLVKIVTPNKKLMLQMILLGILSLISVSFWLLPTSTFVKEGLSGIVGGIFSLESWLNAQSSNLTSVFLGLPNYLDYFPFRYGMRILYLLSFIPILGLVVLVSMPSKTIKKNRLSLAILLVWVLFAILTKKTQPPFGDLTLQLFKLPLLATLRSYEKAGIFLSFLLFMSTYGLIPVQWFKSKYLYITLALYLLSALPFFIGNIQTRYSITFPTDKDYLTSEYSGLVKVPDDYYQIAKHLNNDKKDFKIQALPYSVLNTIAWMNYPAWKLIGTNPADNLFDHAVISQNSSMYSTQGFLPSGELNITTLDPLWYLKTLPYFNVSYLIYHFDVSKEFVYTTLPKINSYIERGYIKKVAETDLLTLFELSDEFKQTHFYIPTSTIVLHNDINVLPYALSFETKMPNQFVMGADVIKVGQLDYFADTYISSFEEVESIKDINEVPWEREWEWPEINNSSASLRRLKNLLKREIASTKEEELNLTLTQLVFDSQEIDLTQDYRKRELLNNFTESFSKTREILGEVDQKQLVSSINKVQGYLARILKESKNNSVEEAVYLNLLLEFTNWTKGTYPELYCSGICYAETLPEGNYSVYLNYLTNSLLGFESAEINGNSIALKGSTNKNYPSMFNVELDTKTELGLSLKPISVLSPLSIVPDNSSNQIIVKQDLDETVLYPHAYAQDNIALFEISEFDPAAEYFLTFSYKSNDVPLTIEVGENVLDKNITVPIEKIREFSLNTENIPLVKQSVLKESVEPNLLDKLYIEDLDGDWYQYETKFNTSLNSTSGYLIFQSSGNKYAFDPIEIRDIKITKAPSVVAIAKKDRERGNTSPTLPNLISEKISDTKYVLSITDSYAPYPLVFSETFHKNWKVYLEGNEVAGNSHYKANGYANGWIINPPDVENRSEYTLVVEFESQNLLILGGLITSTTLLACLIIIVLPDKIYARKK